MSSVCALFCVVKFDKIKNDGPVEAVVKDILIIGAGKIGATLAAMLAACPEYRVTLADCSEAQLAAHGPQRNIAKARLDVRDDEALAALLKDCFAVLSAVPFHLTTRIAEMAAQAHIHYLDLTEDVASARHVRALAEGAGSAFIPQCGLAPGFVSIVAGDLAKRFDTLDTMTLRAGALPLYPSNALGYNLTWSTDGLINEYCEPCDAIVDGAREKIQPLREREEFSFDGVRYEAFDTSGGIGSLCESLAGKVRTLNYRTIRYPGHYSIMKALLHDLRLKERRAVLKDILENAVPATNQDVVILLVTASGLRGGLLTQETYANKIYGRRIGGAMRSAIQATTASAAAAVLDLLACGKLALTGFVRQEDISLDAVWANRFGQVFAVAGQTRAGTRLSDGPRLNRPQRLHRSKAVPAQQAAAE